MCMCVCIFECVCAFMCMFAHARVLVCTFVHTSVCACAYGCLHVCVCARLCICVCVCMYVCVCVSSLRPGEKVMQDDEFTCDLFRFLQLLCEGHNSGVCAGSLVFNLGI